MKHTERALARLKTESDKRIAEGKAQGLNLARHKYAEWEVEAEKEVMMDELMDCLGDVRAILTAKGATAVRITRALERLGEVEE